jgi:hypothetical protein
MSEPADKILHERELFKAMQSKVIDRAIHVSVDNGVGPMSTWPPEIILKATRQLCKEIDLRPSEDVTPFQIDRKLEDLVVQDAWGSFYWDQSNKRHLKLNPPGWAERGGGG